MINEKERDGFSLAGYQPLAPKLQDQAFVIDQVEQNERDKQEIK